MVLNEAPGDLVDLAVVPPGGTREFRIELASNRIVWLTPSPAARSHYWAIAGYFDAHRHLPPDGSRPTDSKKALAPARIRSIEDAGRDGTWGMRDMGVRTLAPWPVRSDLVATAIRGLIGTNSEFARRFAVMTPDPPHIARAIEENLAAGAHFIKIFTTRSGYLPQAEALEMTMTRDSIIEATRLATSFGLPVAAHCHGGPAFEACLEAGVSSIEHGLYLSEAEVRAAQSAGTEIVLTPGAYDTPATPPSASAAFVHLVEVIADSGTEFRIGTDSPHESMAGQVLALTRRGVPMDVALRAATLDGPLANSSSVVSRATADRSGLVLLETDPTAAPQALLTPAALVAPLNGRDNLRIPMPSIRRELAHRRPAHERTRQDKSTPRTREVPDERGG